jgi:hypothetical protein
MCRRAWPRVTGNPSLVWAPPSVALRAAIPPAGHALETIGEAIEEFEFWALARQYGTGN